MTQAEEAMDQALKEAAYGLLMASETFRDMGLAHIASVYAKLSKQAEKASTLAEEQSR